MTGRFGKLLLRSIAIFHIGMYLYFDFPVIENPLWIAPSLFMPALFILSRAPIQRERSGFIGFLIRIGVSVPFNESAIS